MIPYAPTSCASLPASDGLLLQSCVFSNGSALSPHSTHEILNVLGHSVHLASLYFFFFVCSPAAGLACFNAFLVFIFNSLFEPRETQKENPKRT
eukprot:m.5474 g.5474  ORF g.5474 m.5474 type:complete len:94 (+) comp4537_c0_seq1:711-992(+)